MDIIIGYSQYKVNEYDIFGCISPEPDITAFHFIAFIFHH